MIRRTAALAVLLVAVSFARSAEPKGLSFQPGTRYVWLGDSITEQYQYSTYLELYLTTRFPDAHMVFYNAGIGGDTATGGANRFASHVLAEKPNIVTIDFGMNDGGYGGFDPKRAEQFVKNTEKMLEMAKKAGVKVILISPNAVEVRSRPENSREQFKTYLETQEKFYAPLKELAAKYDVPFVDQYAVTRKVLEKIDADNAKVKPFPDGVHTNAAGGLLMAHTILTGVHAPAEVSKFEFDVGKSGVVVSACEVERPEVTPDHLSFNRRDKALPLPVLKDWRDLLPFVDQLKDLNAYGLTVKGLKSGKYALRIDGQEIATYSADEFADGVNVGNADKGPIYEQGLRVLAAVEAKNKIVHERFRQVVMFEPRQLPEWVAGPGDVIARKRQYELSKRDQEIAAWQAEVYRAAAPRMHHWEIKRAE